MNNKMILYFRKLKILCLNIINNFIIQYFYWNFRIIKFLEIYRIIKLFRILDIIKVNIDWKTEDFDFCLRFDWVFKIWMNVNDWCEYCFRKLKN